MAVLAARPRVRQPLKQAFREVYLLTPPSEILGVIFVEGAVARRRDAGPGGGDFNEPPRSPHPGDHVEGTDQMSVASDMLARFIAFRE